LPKPTVKDRVTEMIRDIVGPGMKAAGFRRNGRVFWRDQPDVCQVVHVQMNRWGTSQQSDFCVLLGVFWHKVEELLQNPSATKMPPPEYKCTIRIELGRVVSTPPKRPWTVTLDSDYAAIGQDVLSDLRRHGMKWFESRSAFSGVLDSKRYAWKGSMQELLNADAKVVFRMLRGERDAAIADLRRFVKNGHAEAALNLAKRLRIAKSEVIATDGQPAAT
jgi:Domain of unknown function (DUF4304)